MSVRAPKSNPNREVEIQVVHIIRRLFAVLGFATMLAPLAAAQNTSDNAARITALRRNPVVIRGGWLFTGTSDTVVRNEGILIVAGRLLAVNRAIIADEAQGARIIQLRDDQYVLPGIFDVHAHYNTTMGPRGLRSDEWTYNPLIFLANGVTSTFPAGEYDPDSMMATRKRIDTSEQVGPRIYNSGPYFGTARRGWNQSATAADIDRDVDY